MTILDFKWSCMAWLKLAKLTVVGLMNDICLLKSCRSCFIDAAVVTHKPTNGLSTYFESPTTFWQVYLSRPCLKSN